MARIVIALAAAASCLRCPWTAAGTMADTDRAADKHTRTRAMAMARGDGERMGRQIPHMLGI